MVTDIFMPWWAWGYLLFVSALFTMGFFAEQKVLNKRVNMHALIASCCSLFCICVFVIGFFNPNAVRVFGVMILPMVGVGLYWEFTKAVYETRLAELELQKEGDLSDGEQDFLLNVAIGFNALIVVPGYVAGLVLVGRVLNVICWGAYA